MRQTAVPEPLREDTVGPAEQARRREWFREHWTQAVSGQVVATGQVAVSISGERPGVPWQARGPRR